MAHTRAKLQLETNKEVAHFVADINSDGTTSKWMLENFEGDCRVSARSFLGALYAASEWGGEIYLVNDTSNEPFPSFVDKYRA